MGSLLLYLLSRRTVAGALGGSWLLFLGLGLWYGWQGATYLWAFQWAVYGTGILLLWAWLALGGPHSQTPRWNSLGALSAVGFVTWGLGESFHLVSRPIQPSPLLSEVGFLWTHPWAPLFAWASLTITAVWLLLGLLWPHFPVSSL
ncbi:MAG: hypothetical protein NZ958_03965 [Bacteroidia bacterium]|nr:hypothetical protein [Bacteroidia bacterium]MDW8088374.1 hypothetical protein [Bacteroidia bacterium]